LARLTVRGYGCSGADDLAETSNAISKVWAGD
jgi:hypothetical protein